jgi:hypothetical protein
MAQSIVVKVIEAANLAAADANVRFRARRPQRLFPNRRGAMVSTNLSRDFFLQFSHLTLFCFV